MDSRRRWSEFLIHDTRSPPPHGADRPLRLVKNRPTNSSVRPKRLLLRDKLPLLPGNAQDQSGLGRWRAASRLTALRLPLLAAQEPQGSNVALVERKLSPCRSTTHSASSLPMQFRLQSRCCASADGCQSWAFWIAVESRLGDRLTINADGPSHCARFSCRGRTLRLQRQHECGLSAAAML
jgi:hypothetical protein